MLTKHELDKRVTEMGINSWTLHMFNPANNNQAPYLYHYIFTIYINYKQVFIIFTVY